MSTITMREDLEQSKPPADVLYTFCSSGSTGKHKHIYFTKKSWEKAVARVSQAFSGVGISAKDTVLNMFSQGPFISGKISDEALTVLGANTIPFGQYHDSAVQQQLLKALVLNNQPTVLFAFPNQLPEILSFLDYPFPLIVVGGEVLQMDYVRKIEKKYHTKLIDLYGANEIGLIAIGKPGAYLEVADDLQVEILQDGVIKQEGIGDILVTDPFHAPLQRYFLGDRVALQKNQDKIGIKFISRTDDYLNFNGELISSSLVVQTIMNQIGHTSFFLILQKEKESYKDTCLLTLQKKDRAKAALLKKRLAEIGMYPKILFTHVQPRTNSSGKTIHIIDRRHGKHQTTD